MTIAKNGLKKFNVTFSETKKYNPATRTVMVEAKDDIHAGNLVFSQFGSYRYDKKSGLTLPSNCKIKMEKIEEIKDEVEEVL